MHSHGVVRSLLVLGLAISSATTFADGPADNNPDTVRPVPKVGVEVPDADRKELEAGLAKLGKLLDEIRPKGRFGSWEAEGRIPETAQLLFWDNYADVAIFHRAVRVALEDQEFFDPKEIGVAKQLLQTGIERAEQLKASTFPGRAPWHNQKGLVVRGYMSRIDHTPQPYGLIVPESYSTEQGASQRHRVDVWWHGRGETLSEVNFISQRLASAGPITPNDTIVLHPYGRYCNANKFAGEIDTFEALAAVMRNYRIDQRKIAARGFSMGGAACWQFAVHFPSFWYAATPGAGFSETPEFLKFFQKETLDPPWWEAKLWRWYDCPGYVANLKNLPVVAYSGENDIQKQAADIMETAYEKEGLKLLHLIGPKTGHSIHPDAAKEIEANLLKWAEEPNPFETPGRLEFVTYSLVYPSGGWVLLEGLKTQWEEARIVAELKENEIQVTTKNITQLALRLPQTWRDGQPKLKIDGDEVDASRPRFRLKEGHWSAEIPAAKEQPLRKSPLFSGPIDHAFMNSFLIVKPSGKSKHPALQKWVDAEMERAITQWRRQFRGDALVKLDTEVTEDDVKSANLVLWGDRASNQWIAKIADEMPIGWDAKNIAVGDDKFDAENHALIAIFPNPKNDNKYIVLNSGFTYREYDYLNNARQTAKLPDWAVVDLRTPPNSRWPGKIVAADFFDEEWKLKPRKE